MIRTYTPSDALALYGLWSTLGKAAGYAPLSLPQFQTLFLEHSDFSPALTFLWEEDGAVTGFAAGCTGSHIPRGDVRGYVSLVLASTDEATAGLLDALEHAFRKLGKTESAVTFFNPIRLPWVIPGTQGHQHNNMPGIATDLPLFRQMLDAGYREAAREWAMHLDLAGWTSPPWVRDKARAMAQKGLTVDFYRPGVHTHLQEMADSLGNPQWSAEIPAAGAEGLPLLVALSDNRCAGFAGPIYPEPTGRGYFAGIGIDPRFQRLGLGTVLFFRLVQAEQAAGAGYMSLFTGANNPAKSIYQSAGFSHCRSFGVMIKEL